MIDLLHRMIPSLKGEEQSEPTKEETLALEKKERIEFHRRSVRNGPISFKTPTNGQIRRMRARTTQGMMKRARRSQIRSYFESQQEGMILRGHLQTIGVIEFAGPDLSIPSDSVKRSAVWLIQHFAEAPKDGGPVEVTAELVRDSFQSALNRFQTIYGMPLTALPEGYVVPA